MMNPLNIHGDLLTAGLKESPLYPAGRGRAS